MPELSRAEKLLALRLDFQAQLPDRLRLLKAAWDQVDAGPTGSLVEFHRLIHGLAGTAGTFGLPEVSTLARGIEALLTPGETAALSSLRKTEITTLLARLNATVEALNTAPPPRPQPESPRIPPPPGSAEGLALIGVDPTVSAEMEAQLRAYGWNIRRFEHLTTALPQLAVHRPEAVILDCASAGGDLACFDRLRRARADLGELPIVVLAEQWDWDTRLAAARAQVDAFLVKPVDFSSLTEAIDQLTRPPGEDPYRVLVLDDTPILAEHYREVLNAAGMRATAIFEPRQLLEQLDVHQPELVLMDLYMPECGGVEAARIIRQDERHTSMPIVFLSTESGREQQLAAMRAGADDFLTKPIRDADLVAAVSMKVARFRALAGLISQDSLTGLLNRIAFDLRTEAEIARARRNGAPLVLAMLDIDHFKRINDSHGHPVGDRVIRGLANLLRRRLRKYDVVGRYGGEEFSILMPNTPLATATGVLNALLAQFRVLRHGTVGNEFGCTFSAGLAALLPGMDGHALVAAADHVLYDAKHLGRDRVIAAPSTEETT